MYKAVAQIPRGSVATYGMLAVLAGGGQWARRAGRAMKNSPGGIPCHRVVNSAGRTVPGWAEQRKMLEQEGVRFKPNGMVDMKAHRWDIYK